MVFYVYLVFDMFREKKHKILNEMFKINDLVNFISKEKAIKG